MDKPKSNEILAGEAAAAWWQELRPDPDRDYRGDRAAIARLRRMGTVPEALVDPAIMLLIRKIAEATGWPLVPTAAWVSPAAIAGLTLAHLSSRGEKSMAEALGQEIAADRPRYSGLRFTRLIRAESDEERLTQLGRAARRLRADDAAVNIARLATDLFRLWRDPDAVRRDWTFAYHQMTGAAPNSQASSATPGEEISR